MKKLFIVFDQLSNKTSGGLLATYINLSELLKDKYEIHIISIFDYEKNDDQLFKNNKKHIINSYTIDNRFYKIFKHLKKLELKKALKALKSGFYYFFTIPRSKRRIKKLINPEDLVIVSCPAAAMFIPKSIQFILEVHIHYRYFFGNNLLGTIQAKLMTKPTLTLFRTKYDAQHVSKNLNPDYIYNFFDNKNSKVSKKLVKNKILFMGRISDVKNPLRLIEIAAELKKINPNFSLDIYGTGDLFEKCNDRIKQLELENQVFMKGFTNDKNIYSQYSLLVLTSKLEGLPMVIIEAKACGIPTISTNWGDSIHEVIEDGKDGFIIDDNIEFAQKINEILTDENLQQKLSQKALQNFETFSKDNAKKRWIYLLENYKKNKTKN